MEHRKPVFRQALVLYADILGWKADARSAFANGTQGAFLHTRRQILRRTYQIVRKRATEYSGKSRPLFATKVFTDNIVVAMPQWSDRGGKFEPEWRAMIDICVGLQFGLSLQGILLRGGISIGEHYMDDDLAIGDALLEAVESDVSGGPPRIVLTDSCKALVEAHGRSYDGGIEAAPHCDQLMVDGDGAIFVDYLSEIFSALNYGQVFTAELERHRDVISKGLQNREPTIAAKYEWAATYHNDACTGEGRPFTADDREQAAAMLHALGRLSEYAIPLKTEGVRPRR